MRQGDRLPSPRPVDDHLTPSAIGLISGALQVAVFPEPFHQLPALDLPRQVGCVKIIADDLWVDPSNT
jgi:hypothetical protein